ncbi:MAG: nicotinate phosphoribosyltransferase [Pirellulales bacterium]|nr:nicotinate phosphoribosyltransferase [Pirellulales bacterium]
MLVELYRPSLALLTDLYQLTMAYGYWKLGRADQEAVFHLFFRRAPFGGGLAVAAGLEPALDYVAGFRFDEADLAYLSTLVGNDGAPLFEQGFLEYLAGLKLTCDLDALPEGTVAFGQVPLVRVRGSLLQCQLLETPLLNLVNFSTLVATKAARVAAAAAGESVLEFGLRRAQGIDGGLTASRAAYLGGCDSTSNVLAGRLYGIPVSGTHAHSWVMAFDSELEAFEQYAEAMPNNCVFLVDTYDTLEGVRHAARVGQRLKAAGHRMIGIRLDSGDLAYLSIETRKILDAAGLHEVAIVASNDLDERIIESLKQQGAKITVWGVGTKLATAYDQPALGGVYKLGAIRDDDGTWQPKMKLSEQAAKSTVPGILQVRRFEGRQGFVADLLYDELAGVDPRRTIVDIKDPHRRKQLASELDATDLLIPYVRQGEIIARRESLDEIRQRVRDQLAKLHPSIRRFLHPHEYPVGLDIGLHERREAMIRDLRQSLAAARSKEPT